MAVATGTALLGAAALGTAASVYSGSKASSAAKSAAKTQAASSNYATDMQMKFLEENRADINKAVKAGLIDLDTGFNMAIQQLQPFADQSLVNRYTSILNDPSSVLNTPTNKYQFQQGVEALQAAFSKSSGGGPSGNAFKAAMEYGQNFASTLIDQELARLEPTLNARSNIASLYSSLGTGKSNLRIGGATGSAQITGSAAPSIASTIMSSGNANAAGTINAANAWTGTINSITDNVSNLAALYAIKPSLFTR